MAFKLTKTEKARLEEVAEALRFKAATLEDAVREFNEKLEAMRNEVILVEHDYNSVLSDAREFVEEVAQRIDGDIDEKSERWQEGERGQAAAEWHDAWQGADLDDLDLDYPEDMDEPTPGHVDTLEGLPQEASS